MPPRSGGPRDDDRGEDFDWLYGGRGSAPPPSDDPEPTRMMPTMRRPGSEDRSERRPEPGPAERPRRSDRDLRPAQPEPSRRPRRSGRSRWRTVKWVLALWLVFLIAVPVWAVSSIEKVPFAPDGERPEATGGTTYLLVGSDSREGLTAEQRREYGTGDAEGRRTDTIMLLHTGSGPNVLISIPRDSLVEIPGYGTTKVNAAYAFGGAQLLTQTLESELGLRIDEYVEIGMGGLVNVVDAVGGIEVCTPKRLVDRQAALRLARGCSEVDGPTALAFARTRKTQTMGDIDRGTNQRQVIAKIGDKVASPWSVINPIRYVRLNRAGSTSVKVGEGTGPIAMGGFAWGMTRTAEPNGMTCTMPISDFAVNWDRERVDRLMGLLREDAAEDITGDLCTPSGLPE